MGWSSEEDLEEEQSPEKIPKKNQNRPRSDVAVVENSPEAVPKKKQRKTKSEKNEGVDKAALIAAVQREPYLWDISLDDYSKHDKTADSWANVQKELATTLNVEYEVEVLKKEWKQLRQTHRRNCVRQTTGSGATQKKPWPFMQQMDFVRRSVADQERFSNVDIKPKVVVTPVTTCRERDDDESSDVEVEVVAIGDENSVPSSAVDADFVEKEDKPVDEVTPHRRVLGESSTPKLPARHKKKPAAQDILVAGLKCMESISQGIDAPGDRFDNLGTHLADSMRMMSSKNQRKVFKLTNKMIADHLDDDEDDED